MLLAESASPAGAALPRIADLAADMGVHERTIRRSLSRISEHSMLTVQNNGNQHRPTSYQLAMSDLDTPDTEVDTITPASPQSEVDTPDTEVDTITPASPQSEVDTPDTEVDTITPASPQSEVDTRSPDHEKVNRTFQVSEVDTRVRVGGEDGGDGKTLPSDSKSEESPQSAAERWSRLSEQRCPV